MFSLFCNDGPSNEDGLDDTGQMWDTGFVKKSDIAHELYETYLQILNCGGYVHKINKKNPERIETNPLAEMFPRHCSFFSNLG